jgi:ribonuclease G
MTDESPKEEILVNVTPSEVRAALLENGILQEVYIERAARRGLVSNIYKGRVSRVLPGMQAAFIDIGLERTAFLHASDIVRPRRADDEDNDIPLPDIRQLVHDGEEIPVQVVKDPLGNKGARLTTFITLPSRYLVLLSGFRHGSRTRMSVSACASFLRNCWSTSPAGSSFGRPRKAPATMPCGRT